MKFCLVRCNAHERVQALPTMPRHGVNTVDAPLQERVKSRKNYIVFISVIGNPLKVDILLSRATTLTNRNSVVSQIKELRFDVCHEKVTSMLGFNARCLFGRLARAMITNAILKNCNRILSYYHIRVKIFNWK